MKATSSKTTTLEGVSLFRLQISVIGITNNFIFQGGGAIDQNTRRSMYVCCTSSSRLLLYSLTSTNALCIILMYQYSIDT